jgi:hypothetical protein
MARRKKRTRTHVIADLSFHHVGYFVVREGFTLEAVEGDYGLDAWIITFAKSGEVENGMIYVQLKASDNIVRKPGGIAFRVKKSDVDLWESEPMPVYLVLFDVAEERAYWMYFQRYAAANGISAATMKHNSVEVLFDEGQVVDETAVRQWRADKADVLEEIAKVDRG